MGVYHRRNI